MVYKYMTTYIQGDSYEEMGFTVGIRPALDCRVWK